MDLLTPKLELFTDHELLIDDKNDDDNNESIIDREPPISQLIAASGANQTKENELPVKKYKKKRQICTICSVSYSKREYLSKHMKNEHNILLEKKPPGRQSTFIRHENDPRPYKCDECVKEYTKSKHLARHKRTHTDIKRCNECNEICGNYADHMLKKHGIDLPRPFECDICKKAYRTKSNVQSHMRIHRAASRVFQCTVCPKSFCFATDLRKHMKTHSQNRSIICDICGDAFKSSDTLKCHMRRHTGERPYKCSQCPRAFSTSNSLDIHFRTHTGERPFQCEFCEKRFSDSSTLLVHKRLHTNENPYICHLCGRRTKQASNLRSHYKHFHKNNDISGRQIRSNSRIFKRFSQSEIDIQLQETGDLMALLERGFKEFHREEKEKSNQIEKALEVINKPIQPSTLATEHRMKVETGTVEIQTKDKNIDSNQQVAKRTARTSLARTVKDVKSVKAVKTVKTAKAVENPSNCDVVKNEMTTKPYNDFFDDIPNAYSDDLDNIDDIKDIEPDLSSFDNDLIYDSVALPVNKGILKIESVFIEDASCSQPEVESFPINDLKKEEASDADDYWPNNHFDDSSNEIYPTIKCEATELQLPKQPSDKSASKLSKSKPLNKSSNESIKKDIGIAETSESSVQNDHKSKEIDIEKLKKVNRPKVVVPKIEMERCKPCNRKFHDMAKHWVEFHSGIERPYECFICHRDYKRFEHMKYHMKTHGNERNYICHVCGDAFFLSNELRKHIMNRHQVERPFKCNYEQCKKCFKNQHALNVHMRTHSGVKPFVCKVCSEAFSALSSLKIHERKHTGDKPYICKYCDKAFADCSTHRQHERIHTGEKPYRCHLCERRTAQAGNLKSHYRHYHKIIVKSVSMYVDNNSSHPIGEAIHRNPFDRGHSYPVVDASRRIEE